MKNKYIKGDMSIVWDDDGSQPLVKWGRWSGTLTEFWKKALKKYGNDCYSEAFASLEEFYYNAGRLINN